MNLIGETLNEILVYDSIRSCKKREHMGNELSFVVVRQLCQSWMSLDRSISSAVQEGLLPCYISVKSAYIVVNERERDRT